MWCWLWLWWWFWLWWWWYRCYILRQKLVHPAIRIFSRFSGLHIKSSCHYYTIASLNGLHFVAMLPFSVLLRADLLANSWYVFQGFFPVTSCVYKCRDRFSSNIHILFISVYFSSFFPSFSKTLILLVWLYRPKLWLICASQDSV